MAALCLAVAVPVPASGGAGGEDATVAKKKCKKKKRKKCKKKAPAPVIAPATPTPLIPQPNCPGEDAFEPNDGFAQATAFPYSGQSNPGVMGTYFRCPSNSDFFTAPIAAGDYAAIVVDPDNNLDARVNVYDQAGTLTPGSPYDVGGAGVTEPNANFNNIMGGATTFYIEVTSGTAASSGSYTLQVYST